ncbi:hypothetical protein [Corynebacterium sp. 70RC1]|nr:hypothetical protein [Corynebacterium sp. 70RC1]
MNQGPKLSDISTEHALTRAQLPDEPSTHPATQGAPAGVSRGACDGVVGLVGLMLHWIGVLEGIGARAKSWAGAGGGARNGNEKIATLYRGDLNRGMLNGATSSGATLYTNASHGGIQTGDAASGAGLNVGPSWGLGMVPTMMKGAVAGIVAVTIAACSPGQTALMGAADVLTEKSASNEQGQVGESGLAGEDQQSGQNQGGNAGSGNETSGVGVDFDPNDPDFDFFDPCDGTTPEQKIAMGLPGEYEYANVDLENFYSQCDFQIRLENGDPATVWLISATNSIDDIRENITVIDESPESKLNGVIWYSVGHGATEHCVASVNTTRGRVQATYLSIFDERGINYICAEAQKYLEDLTQLIY